MVVVMASDRDRADYDERDTIDYLRSKLDAELSDFDEFMRDEYGDELIEVEGDLDQAVDTMRDIDVEYRLEDRSVTVESYTDDDGDDMVSFTVYGDDFDAVTDLKNTIVDKGDGNFEIQVEDGILYKGRQEDPNREASYDTVEPVLDIEKQIDERYDGDVTVRPLDDEIDATQGTIEWGRDDGGNEYLREATIDIETDETLASLHLTQQHSIGDTRIRFIADADDDSLEKDLYQLVHGRYMAMDDPDEVELGQLGDFVTTIDGTDLEDVGGLDDVKHDIQRDIIQPMRYPEQAQEAGVRPTNGALFHGGPGTGKTLMARAIAGETDATFYNIDMSKLLDKYVGETEEHLDKLFTHAAEQDRAIMFFDEADTAMPSRGDADREHTKNMTNTILKRLDGFDDQYDVVAIAATNRIEDMDQAALRSGRIDDSYEFGLPEAEAREEILDIHIDEVEQRSGNVIFDEIDYETLVEEADGASGADIETWVEKAVRHSAYGEIEPDEPPSTDPVTTSDFLSVLDELDLTGDEDEELRYIH